MRPATKVKDLTEDEATRIRKVIQDEGRVEGDLRKEVALNIKRLMEIGCYRGCVTAAACRCAASARTPTRAPARARARARSPARRS